MYNQGMMVTVYEMGDGRYPKKAEAVELFPGLILNPWEYDHFTFTSVSGWDERTDIIREFEMLDLAFGPSFNVVLKDAKVEYHDRDHLPEGEEFPGWYVYYKDAFSVMYIGGMTQQRRRDGIHPTGRPKRIPGVTY